MLNRNQAGSESQGPATAELDAVHDELEDPEVDGERVRRAQRLIDLGLLDRPEVVDQAVEQLLERFMAGELHLVSVEGEVI